MNSQQAVWAAYHDRIEKNGLENKRRANNEITRLHFSLFSRLPRCWLQ
jgi:hypothetical protein